MRLIKLTVMNYASNNKVTRDYMIASFQFSDFSEKDQSEIIACATQLINQANDRAANNGEVRGSKRKENDAYAGILAEFATLYFLNNSDNVINAYRPAINDTKNQIDILIEFLGREKPLSAEVRSSFVKNGLNFGLFAVNSKTGRTYFDLIGPYYQMDYKTTCDPLRNLYFRVLFNGPKYDVKRRFVNNTEPFFLIGYQTGDYIIDHGFKKTLLPGSAVTKVGELTGEYIVLPINRVIDLSSPFNYLG